MRARHLSFAATLIGALSVSAFGVVQRTQTFDANPNWLEANNRLAADSSNQNFGFSDTNHAGAAAGETGGFFYRTNYTTNQASSSYADDLGAGGVDIRSPLSFSGSFNPVSGGAVFLLGFFNSTDSNVSPPLNYRLVNTLGLKIDGRDVLFYDVTNSGLLSGITENRIAQATAGQKNTFSFTYTPGPDGDSNGIPDSATVSGTVNGTTITNTLTNPSQLGLFSGPFDRFGLHNLASDSAQGPEAAYFDDLTYTAATAVPEPATLGLLSCLGLLSLRRHGRGEGKR
jgi:hypothetical protein